MHKHEQATKAAEQGPFRPVAAQGQVNLNVPTQQSLPWDKAVSSFIITFINSTTIVPPVLLQSSNRKHPQFVIAANPTQECGPSHPYLFQASYEHKGTSSMCE